MYCKREVTKMKKFIKNFRYPRNQDLNIVFKDGPGVITINCLKKLESLWIVMFFDRFHDEKIHAKDIEPFLSKKLENITFEQFKNIHKNESCRDFLKDIGSLKILEFDTN